MAAPGAEEMLQDVMCAGLPTLMGRDSVPELSTTSGTSRNRPTTGSEIISCFSCGLDNGAWGVWLEAMLVIACTKPCLEKKLISQGLHLANTHTHLETSHASTAMVGYPPFVCMRVLFELSFHISAFEGFAFF